MLLADNSKATLDKVKCAFTRADWRYIRAEIASGESVAYTCNELALVIRFERSNNHYVIVGAAGQGINRAIPFLLHHAKQNGFDFIRFHNAHGKTPKAVSATLTNRSCTEHEFLVSVEHETKQAKTHIT